MQSSHAAGAVDVAFDDPNLIADAGLVPVLALAERVGVAGLVGDRVKIVGAANSGGANAGAKVMSLLGGMIAGADSIEDTDRLRHGGMAVAFDGVRAPSTLGTFLRSFTHGHVRQLHGVHRQVLIDLAAATPLLPGAAVLAFVDVDSAHRQVYGYSKQGAEVGRLKGKKTLHPLVATISTPLARPVVAGIRMRKGKAADVRGAAGFVAEALATAKAAGATGTIIVRGDSKFYTADVVAAVRRAAAHVSLTTGSNPSVDAAIAAYTGEWTPIHYPNAFVDPDTGDLVSDAEVAEMPYVAFSSRPKKLQAPGRLIVRRVKRLNPTNGQGELFDVYRHHAVFTTSAHTMLQAETEHRGHAVIEQVIADAKASALAHLPSASFQANAAWATLWAIAHNLTRATGALASPFHTRATTTTIRAHLINIPARLARTARRLKLHLPQNWPWQDALDNLHTAVRRRPPQPA
ncbi:IS1380 family transposase [Kribbella sp. NPDC026596]|uniref:IS1380 family transposase n=1 Tax=Kribbella sp. NPDC026596 TaxID=3155122 RepID=UPI0033FDC173